MIWGIVALASAGVTLCVLWYRASNAALNLARALGDTRARLAEYQERLNHAEGNVQALEFRLRDKERALEEAHKALRDAGGRCDDLAKRLVAGADPRQLGDLVNTELRAIANLAKGRPPTHR